MEEGGGEEGEESEGKDGREEEEGGEEEGGKEGEGEDVGRGCWMEGGGGDGGWWGRSKQLLAGIHSPLCSGSSQSAIPASGKERGDDNNLVTPDNKSPDPLIPWQYSLSTSAMTTSSACLASDANLATVHPRLWRS